MDGNFQTVERVALGKDPAEASRVFAEYFKDHPPARICSVQDLVVDCKVEVDLTCYRADRA